MQNLLEKRRLKYHYFGQFCLENQQVLEKFAATNIFLVAPIYDPRLLR